ncbi:MAG: LysM peptidoglycan-binding domain-containing protein [Nitrosomonas sp.]|jgi:hypothetical protein
MQKLIITAFIGMHFIFASPIKAENIILRSDAPEHHTVVPGDTLWGIAARFLKDPWRWPEVWNINRDQVKNPHKIYPGETIVLERLPDGPRLRLSRSEGDLRTVKLSPRIRVENDNNLPIPGISRTVIEPFLSQPLIIEKDGLANAPYILGSSDGRVILSTGNTAYVTGLPPNQGRAWQIFRPGKPLLDPDKTNLILGYEAVYLGNVTTETFAETSTVTITRAKEEILKGDRLVAAPDIIFDNYMPHAPNFSVNGRIISVYGGVTEIGKDAIVTLNRGAEDGLEMGHVLAVYRRSQARSLKGDMVQLPDERTGLVFVFRVFEKISYALVVQSTLSIKVLDAVKTP